MHPTNDFDRTRSLPPGADHLIQDLELETLFEAMANGDRFLLSVAKVAVLSSLVDPDQIRYRQQVLADCLEHRDVIHDIYQAALDAIEGERKQWALGHSAETLLSRSVQVLDLFMTVLRRLREIAGAHRGRFRSAGFRRFYTMLEEQLPDDYFAEINEQLTALRFPSGALLSANLGPGNKGVNYVLRTPAEHSWRERLSPFHRDGLSFQVAERDEAGARAISELKNQGIDPAANAVAQAAEHILAFFVQLAAELAFYIGAVNLHERLASDEHPTCLPDPIAGGETRLRARGLYDACLALRMPGTIVSNDLNADVMSLIMITGANQGGKSTFLRALGLAQLMMQSGLFVASDAFTADVRAGLFTHYKREEDDTMHQGKLDEELGRMNEIAERLRSGGLLLCNESFASTNEREGSEIARQVIGACRDAGIKVVFVTHLYDLAHSLAARPDGHALFLRADRSEDGSRSFRIAAGEPLPTSYGEDTYRKVFNAPGVV